MTQSNAPYTPNSGSLASQVMGYLHNNPRATLTLEDITSRFDGARGNIPTLLAKAVEAGYIVRSRDALGDYIYLSGQQAPSPGVNIAAVHTRHKPRQVSTVVMPGRLEVRSDPVPALRPPVGYKYDAVFEQLSPGKCVRCKTSEVGSVTNSLKKYLWRKSSPCKVKATTRYICPVTGVEDLGYGRVWMLDGVVA